MASIFLSLNQSSLGNVLAVQLKMGTATPSFSISGKLLHRGKNKILIAKCDNDRAYFSKKLMVVLYLVTRCSSKSCHIEHFLTKCKVKKKSNFSSSFYASFHFNFQNFFQVLL